MKIVRLALGDLRWTTIPVGFAGENDCTQVQIDCAQEFAEFPTAIPSLTIKSPRRGEGPYPGIVERDGDLVIWTVSGSDLMNSGTGEIQLSFIVDNVIEKSYVAKIRIHRSLLPGEEIPDPIDDWITRANAVLGEIPQTIAESVDAALEEAKESGEFDGKDGDPGLDGFSPAASVSKTGNKTTIVITDKDGTTSAEILDGEDGEPGDPGEPGYTPQRGVDYWTEADQQAMREDIASDTAAARQAIAGDKADALTAIGSAGTTQVGNVNTAGTTQVGNVNTAGTTQVGNVNAAGAAQVAAVEEKGEEVLDSIPSDYSELSGEVSQLKNEVDEIAYKPWTKVEVELLDQIGSKIAFTTADGGTLWDQLIASLRNKLPIEYMDVTWSGADHVTGTMPTQAAENSQFSVTLFPSFGYEITSLSAVMGEDTYTGTAGAGGAYTLTIASVTDDVTVTVATQSVTVETIYSSQNLTFDGSSESQIINTGFEFGSNTAEAYTESWTLMCSAESTVPMSGGNWYGAVLKIGYVFRWTDQPYAIMSVFQEDVNIGKKLRDGKVGVVITHYANDADKLTIYSVQNNEVVKTEKTSSRGNYGLNNSDNQGELELGGKTTQGYFIGTIHDITIYKAVLDDASIEAYLLGGEQE